MKTIKQFLSLVSIVLLLSIGAQAQVSGSTVQVGSLSARPAGGTGSGIYFITDEGQQRFCYWNGSQWVDIAPGLLASGKLPTAQAPTSVASAATLSTARTINGVSFDGSADIVAALSGRVTGSNFTTTGQALTDITGLSVPLSINSVYEFEAVLSVSTTAVTTGTQYGVNYSVAGASIEAQIHGSLTSTAAKMERISALNTASSAFLTTSGQTGAIYIRGVIATGANAGNLTIKTLKVTSGTSTVFINSFLKATKIG